MTLLFTVFLGIDFQLQFRRDDQFSELTDSSQETLSLVSKLRMLTHLNLVTLSEERDHVNSVRTLHEKFSVLILCITSFFLFLPVRGIPLWTQGVSRFNMYVSVFVTTSINRILSVLNTRKVPRISDSNVFVNYSQPH